MSHPCPKIYTYENPDAPPHMRAIAALPMDGPGMHWTTTGATLAEAEQKLRAFWATTELGRPPKKPRKPKSEATGDVLDDDFDVI